MRYVTALFAAVLSFICVTLGSAGIAYAATDGSGDGSLLDLVQPVIHAFTSGNPALAAALALVLAVALARRYAPASWGLATDIGGTAVTFLASLGTAAAAALTAGTLPSWGLLYTAATIAAAASGGYTAVRRLAVPALRWLESKIPAGLRKFVSPLFNVILYVFESRGAAVKKAEAAGAAAVKAKPGTGADGIVGKPRDIR